MQDFGKEGDVFDKGVQLIRSPRKNGGGGPALVPMLKSLHHGPKGRFEPPWTPPPPPSPPPPYPAIRGGSRNFGGRVYLPMRRPKAWKKMKRFFCTEGEQKVKIRVPNKRFSGI